MFLCPPPGGTELSGGGRWLSWNSIVVVGWVSLWEYSGGMCRLIKPENWGPFRFRALKRNNLFFSSSVTKEVVSMGTGTKCIGQSKMRKSGKPEWGLNGACPGNGVHVAFSSPLQGEGAMLLKWLIFHVDTDCHSHLKNGNKLWKQRLPRIQFLGTLKAGQYFRAQTRSSLGLAIPHCI